MEHDPKKEAQRVKELVSASLHPKAKKHIEKVLKRKTREDKTSHSLAQERKMIKTKNSQSEKTAPRKGAKMTMKLKAKDY
jgi:microcompartment protein CcmL/EutN